MKKSFFSIVLIWVSILWVTNGFILAQTGKPTVKKKGGVRKDIALIPPQRFFLDFNDAMLVYVPATQQVQISAVGTVLSYGGDWESRNVRTYLYHLRQKDWDGFYWKVNTSLRVVYRVTGGTFGGLGGTEHRMAATVNVTGSGPGVPTRFSLRFSRAYLVYQPASENLQIAALGCTLSYGTDWDKCNFNGANYHLKLRTWMGFHWRVNTERPEAYRVTSGPGFCAPGGPITRESLRASVRVIR